MGRGGGGGGGRSRADGGGTAGAGSAGEQARRASEQAQHDQARRERDQARAQQQQRQQAPPRPQASSPRSDYQTLGASASASPSELKSAYRTAALANHPDRFAGQGAAKVAAQTEKLKEINNAYDRLSGRNKR